MKRESNKSRSQSSLAYECNLQMKTHRNANGTDKENNENEQKKEKQRKKNENRSQLPMKVQFPLKVHENFPFYVCYETANTVSNVHKR